MALPSLLPALVLALLTPLVFSLQNLDAYNASIVLERFFCLTGVLLLTPVPLPEQDRNLREVVAGRPTSLTGITLLRFFLVLPALPLLVLGLCGAMAAQGSLFPFAAFWLGGTISAFALGALGFFAFTLSGNWVVGYLAPVCYYTLNHGMGARLGPFYLFSLGQGVTAPKAWLLAAALLLVAASAAFMQARRRAVGV